MKMRFFALLLVAAMCVAFASALADSDDLIGRWADPASDRALLKIIRPFAGGAPEDGQYDVMLTWPDSSDTVTVWHMVAKLDEETGGLTYTSGTKSRVTYAGDGSVAGEEKLWEDSEGALIPAGGKLRWSDSREDHIRAEAGQPDLSFERLPITVPSTDEFTTGYFARLASLEEGTAGASLKQAVAARDVLRFALENGLCYAEFGLVQGNMLKAWEALDSDDRDSFIDNLENIVAPLLSSAFDSYDAVAGSFEDAGVGEDMVWLCGDLEARTSWSCLLGYTLNIVK